MNESLFKASQEALARSIADEISYTYCVFKNNSEKRVIGVMKSNIPLSDRSFLDSKTQNAAKDKLIFPYDFLTANINRHISDFYNQFHLNSQTLIKLSHYGERADIFKSKFKENLEKSKETTKNVVLRELTQKITQDKDAKSVIKHIQSIVAKRTDSLKALLKDSAGQMQRYMLLWDYQDMGYAHYRFKASGETCVACTELDGKVFPIADAEVGINLAPLHPNCDCTAEILDENEAAVLVLNDETVGAGNASSLEYLQTSINQILLGNYTDDTNALGTLGQIAIGLLGLDLPLDIRDLVYDITNFKLTPQHALQTILDTVALLPVIGSVKYTDEAADALKKINKITPNPKHVMAEKTAKINSKDIQFGSKTKSTNKLKNQIENRGWSFDHIKHTIDSPFQIRTSTNRATGNMATVFYDTDGDYVIIDDITHEIVQVSDKLDPDWKPDISIIDPYIKEINKE